MIGCHHITSWRNRRCSWGPSWDPGVTLARLLGAEELVADHLVRQAQRPVDVDDRIGFGFELEHRVETLGEMVDLIGESPLAPEVVLRHRGPAFDEGTGDAFDFPSDVGFGHLRPKNGHQLVGAHDALHLLWTAAVGGRPPLRGRLGKEGSVSRWGNARKSRELSALSCQHPPLGRQHLLTSGGRTPTVREWKSSRAPADTV